MDHRPAHRPHLPATNPGTGQRKLARMEPQSSPRAPPRGRPANSRDHTGARHPPPPAAHPRAATRDV
eukprot:4066189-Heterocapsa_arctica.AAC.1